MLNNFVKRHIGEKHRVAIPKHIWEPNNLKIGQDIEIGTVLKGDIIPADGIYIKLLY